MDAPGGVAAPTEPGRRPRPRGRADTLRIVGVCVSAAVVVLTLTLPIDSPAWVTVSLGADFGALVVFVVAAAPMSGRARAVWWPLGAYLILTVAGDVVYFTLQYYFEVSPFPSWADVLYLASYLPQIAALVVLMRQRQRVWDRQAWIDSAVITVAAVSVAATFILLPMLAQSTPSDLTTYLALAYPLLDLVVLAILIRLTVGGGRPMTSLVLLTGSVTVTLLADLVYNGLAAQGTIDESPRWLDALFTIGILLLAFAVTAPNAAAIGQPAQRGASVMSSARTVALGIGALTAPLLLAIGTWNNSTPQVFFLAVASITINALVLWRILLLLSTVRRQAARLDLLARTDALTGLPNRRSWDFALARAEEAALASGESITVAMADIDHFKDYNDQYGHVAGDALLALCARNWREAVGANAFLARYGGEEFAAFVTGRSADESVEILDRLRRATPLPVTVSIGCARHHDHQPIAGTLAQADEALYVAKAAGRNQLVAASAEDLPYRTPPTARA